ncbi:hypothetical protein C0991_003037 [Blastosporella zonata]|nr:hypothetical protein C0991_003037 [Blastosporella zonata]
MEENRHRQRALEALTHSAPSRPKSTMAAMSQVGFYDSGHSIWSDDAASTRRIPVSGGIESRFNNIDLGHPATPATARMPSRPFSVSVTKPNNHGVEVIWDIHHNSDAESQYSSDTAMEHPEGKAARVSRAFAAPFTLTFWQRLKGDGHAKVGWGSSFKAFATFTWMNVLLIFVPIAWGVHTVHQVSHIAQFFLCFVAIMPLSKILDYGGEQLALYCGRAVGDLIVITLNNAVETALAVVLLMKCDLKLLQSTVIGVVLLRLLLVPGSAFLSGGADVMTQDLHPHVVQMNSTLLTVGALTLLLPAAFFSGLDRMVPLGSLGVGAAISDSVRGDFLKLSRALALFLLVIYVSSRIYLHNPPGEKDDLKEHPNAPAAFKADIAKLEEEEPEVNPWVCIIVLLVTVVLLGFTSEFLVSSVQPMRTRGLLPQEFFGIVLLPLVSFSADGILSTVYFCRRHIRRFRGHAPPPPAELAQGRSIDLGIQFLLFWLPFLVLIAWFSHRPLSLLFDVFEVAILLGACFLVNHVTADAKTNWAEGLMMVVLYLMIAVTVRFYPGQTDIQHMQTCESVAQSLTEPTKNTLLKLPQANLTNLPDFAMNSTAMQILSDRLQKVIELSQKHAAA